MIPTHKKPLLITGFLCLAILTSCNLPTSTPVKLSFEEQAGTLAAQTVQASQSQQPTETHVPANTPAPTKALPTITPAPTLSPTPTEKPDLPTAPSLKNYDFFCAWNGSNNDLSITIEWTDKANNENGYRVYRNGEKLAEVAANHTKYVDTYAVDTGIAVNYAVEAYNEVGVSGQVSVSAACQ